MTRSSANLACSALTSSFGPPSKVILGAAVGTLPRSKVPVLSAEDLKNKLS
jgi:hypothetical protein